MRVLLLLSVLAAPATAQCPDAPDIAGREDLLFGQMEEAVADSGRFPRAVRLDHAALLALGTTAAELLLANP